MRTCSVDGCERGATYRGLCGAHYQRLQKGRPLDSPIKTYVTAPPLTCTVPGCDRLTFRSRLCATHYTRMRLGRPLDAPIVRGRPRRQKKGQTP